MSPAMGLEQQVLVVIRALEGQRYERSSPIFKKALEWIGFFPAQLEVSLKRRLVDSFCAAFGVTEADIALALTGVEVLPRREGKSREEELRALLPKGGWFEWYDNFTSATEGPLSFHIFSSLCVLGASLGRRVFINMGHFKIYPNYAAVMIGPPAIKKTTVGDIARKLVEKSVLCPILPEKATPERMVTLLKECGHQFLYAPEFAVFFGRQRYNEGLATQILRMLDSPDSFPVSTQARGDEEITEPTITLLGCTTPSLLASSTPAEISSSGFLSRLVLIFERTDERCFPIPKIGTGEEKLLLSLERLKAYAGEMKFSPEAFKWFEEWYKEHKAKLVRAADDTSAEVMGRAPTHLLKTSLLAHLVACDNLYLCKNCLEFASKLLTHIETSAPRVVKTLKSSSISQDAEFLLESLRRLGGAADHSALLRRAASRMNAQQFKAHVRTLEESGRVKVSKKGIATYYALIGEANEME